MRPGFPEDSRITPPFSFLIRRNKFSVRKYFNRFFFIILRKSSLSGTGWTAETCTKTSEQWTVTASASNPNFPSPNPRKTGRMPHCTKFLLSLKRVKKKKPAFHASLNKFPAHSLLLLPLCSVLCFPPENSRDFSYEKRFYTKII